MIERKSYGPGLGSEGRTLLAGSCVYYTAITRVHPIRIFPAE